MSDKNHYKRHKEKTVKKRSEKRREMSSIERTVTDDSSTLSENDQRTVAAIINFVTHASRHNDVTKTMNYGAHHHQLYLSVVVVFLKFL